MSDHTLTSSGFCDWKHARGKGGTLTCHDSSCTKHREAFLSWKEYESSVAKNSSIADQIQTGRLKCVEDNRVYVRALFESILFCCQQGILLRGHRETLDEDNTSGTNVGNFRALMVLQSRSNETVKQKLGKQKLGTGPKNATWLGHDMQNSIISLFADSVRAMIRYELQSAKYYTITADETKDISKIEQLSMVLRYDYQCKTYERFISFTKCEALNAEALYTYVMQALPKMDVNISDCVSQCYDGASVMSGRNAGVRA